LTGGGAHPTIARVNLRALFVVAVMLWCARAVAEPTMAIAPFTTGETAPADLQRAFADELPRALAEAGFELVPPNQVDMKIGERPEFLRCRAAGCLAEEAAFLHVRRLLLPRLERAADGGFTVGVSLFDATQKRSIADAVDRCGAAGELHGKLQEMAQKLRADLARPGRLEVTAQPEASLIIDGQAKGSTPWAGDLPAGDHVVTLESGGSRVERDVSVAPGAMARVDVQLTAAPPTAPPSRRNPALRPLKFVTLVGGVLGVGAGAALLALDGRGACSPVSGQRQCPELYDTKLGGAIAVAGGGALVVTSVILFVLDRPRH
jgi:hypothetical protein